MFSSKNATGSPVIKHYCILIDHVRCTGDKNEKDDFGDDDKRNPTKLCLASASLHQHRSPAAVLLWLWRKQQIRDKGKTEMGWNGSCFLAKQLLYIGDFRMFIWKRSVGSFARGDWSLYHPLRKGLTLMSGSMKLTPDLHDAKHFAGYSNLRNNSYFTLISSIMIYNDIYIYIDFRAGFHLLPSRCHFSSNNIWEYQLKVAEAISEDCTFQWSKVFHLSSTLATHPTIQPNLDEFVTGSELCVDCCTVGQVNQGRRLPVKPVQSKECCPENGMAFPMSGQKSSQKGPKPSVRQKWRVDDLLFDFTKQHHFRSV